MLLSVLYFVEQFSDVMTFYTLGITKLPFGVVIKNAGICLSDV